MLQLPAMRSLLERLRDQTGDTLQKRTIFAELLDNISRALRSDGVPDADLGSLSLLFGELIHNELQIAHARRGNSVVVHMLCTTTEALLKLWRLSVSGQLRLLVADVLNDIWRRSNNEQRIDVELHVSIDDFNIAETWLRFNGAGKS